jgi:hypothetical protein
LASGEAEGLEVLDFDLDAVAAYGVGEGVAVELDHVWAGEVEQVAVVVAEVMALATEYDAEESGGLRGDRERDLVLDSQWPVHLLVELELMQLAARDQV